MHNYEVRLRGPQDGTQNLVLVGPGGWSHYFTRNADGSYTPPPGVYSKLVHNDNGSYRVTNPDQSTMLFRADGNLISLSDRFGNYSALEYDSQGRLTSVSDPAGRGRLTFAHDSSSGRLTGVSDWYSPARSVGYQYDTAGRLWKVTDREGNTTTFGYDGSSSRLTTITDANNHIVVTNVYDADGRVASQKDARGLLTGEETTFSYVDNGDGTKTTTITYPSASGDPNYHSTVTETFDSQKHLVRRVSKPTSNASDDITTEFTYDGDSNRASETDGRGNTTNYCYDTDYSGAAVTGGLGNLTRRIDPAPTSGANRPVTLFKYDSNQNLIQTIPPTGVSSGQVVTCATDLSASINLLYATDFGYDSATKTKLESVTSRYSDPDLGQKTAVTKYEYADSQNPGLPTKIIPPRGNTGSTPDYSYATTSAYYVAGDRAGLLQSVIDPLGNKAVYDYDAVGRRISMVDPNGNVSGAVAADHTWQYVYDKEDRLRFAKAPAPAAGGSQLATEYRYDAVGNRQFVIDANGQVTKYVFDERDSLLQVQESAGPWTDPAAPPATVYLTEYTYDNAGSLSRVTRAKGDSSNERATEYQYDGDNRLTKEIQYPNWPSTSGSLTTEYTYDTTGNRHTARDPLGQVTTFGYDALNRLTSVTYSDGVTPNVAYGYDANGARTSMTDGTGLTTYSYDEQGRLLTVTSPGPKTVGYRYDLDGNRTKVIYPDSTAVTYTFDKASRLSSLGDWASRSVTYQYGPDGNLNSIAYPNGTSASYGYDNASRLTNIVNQKGAGFISNPLYQLDRVGNRLSIDDIDPGLGIPVGGREKNLGWGGNSLGQLGDGTTSSRQVSSPSTPVGLSGASELVAADSTSFAVKRDGTVWAWGYGSEGEVGDGDNTYYHTSPVQVQNLTGVTALSSRYRHSLAAKSDGTVQAWGQNTSGQLGDGSTTNRNAPVQVSGLTNVGTVAAGNDHSLALKNDGTVWAWGTNTSGQLGDRTTKNKTSPVQAYGLSGVIGIAAGRGHSLAVRNDYTVWAWGDNTTGQLGDGTTTNRKQPTPIPSLSGIVAVAGGWNFSVALRSDGTVWTWGDNYYGQLGDGTTNSLFVPGQVSGISRVVAVAASNTSVVAVKDDGTVWGWGSDCNLLGQGYPLSCSSPVQANGVTGVSQVSKGSGFWLVHSSGGSPSTSTYGYDQLHRLTSVTAPGGNATYGYDPLGNRSSVTKGATTSYTYDRTDRIQQTGNTAYTLNANGNMVARGSDSFTYDQANRLKSATVGGATSTYAYDGDGKRTSKTVGGVATSYVYDANRDLPVVLDDGSRKYVWGLGLTYAVDRSGNLLVYHTDGLGSERALTDASGSVVQTYRYDEYGVLTQSQGSVSQPFGYTGEQYDPETGFVYLRARYYDPQTGRFISRDSFGGSAVNPASLNKYTYAHANPTNYTDPSGRFIPIIIAGVVVLTAPETAVVIGVAGAFVASQWIAYNQQHAGEIATASNNVAGSIGGTFGRLIGPDGKEIPKDENTYEGTGTPSNPFPGPKEGPQWDRDPESKILWLAMVGARLIERITGAFGPHAVVPPQSVISSNSQPSVCVPVIPPQPVGKK